MTVSPYDTCDASSAMPRWQRCLRLVARGLVPLRHGVYCRPECADRVSQHFLRSLGRRVRERRSSVAVLLCGTSGTGKSTLASLLAARLGITTLLSTVRSRCPSAADGLAALTAIVIWSLSTVELQTCTTNQIRMGTSAV